MTIILALLAIGGAQGQGAALVDPPATLLTAEPGNTITSTVRVANPTDALSRYRISLGDWSLDLAGEFVFAPAGSLARSASTWTTYAPTTVTLEAQEATDVAYDIEVPADAAPGTYRTLLFVEGEPGEVEPGQLGAAVGVRVAHVVYVNVPPLESDGVVSSIFGLAPEVDGSPYTLLVQYANRGNSVQRVDGRVSIRDAQGIEVISVDLAENVVLPASERGFEIALFGPLEPGNYTALVLFDFGDETREVAGTYDFVLEAPLPARPGG